MLDNTAGDSASSFVLGVFIGYVKMHSSIAVWGIQEHKTLTLDQQCMCNVAFLLDVSSLLQQVKYANLNAGHVEPFRSSSYSIATAISLVHYCRPPRTLSA